jgi:hypothetical protein
MPTAHTPRFEAVTFGMPLLDPLVAVNVMRPRMISGLPAGSCAFGPALLRYFPRDSGICCFLSMNRTTVVPFSTSIFICSVKCFLNDNASFWDRHACLRVCLSSLSQFTDFHVP